MLQHPLLQPYESAGPSFVLAGRKEANQCWVPGFNGLVVDHPLYCTDQDSCALHSTLKGKLFLCFPDQADVCT
jgi:hypothetical protein